MIVLAAVLEGAFATGILELSTFDVYVYRDYGEAMVGRAAPYRDFAVEYPPGSLALFVLPALVSDDLTAYQLFFADGMLVAATAMLAGVRRLERRVAGAGVATTFPVVCVFALAALLGSVAFTRFDLVPAALTVGALLALTADRRLIAAVALGTAIAVKLYPAVLLPAVVIHVAQRQGRRAAVEVAALTLLVVAIVYAPFVVLSPSGVLESLDAQLFRSLQIESLPGSLFAAVHRLFGDLPPQSDYYDLPGRSADIVGAASAGIGVSVLIVLWIAQARLPAAPRTLIRFSAAGVATFVAFGKVFSPQYLIWLIPLVSLVGGVRGRIASGLLFVACLLTAVGFPRFFDALRFDVAATPLAAIVARDVLVVSVVAVLSWPRSFRAG